MYPARRMLIGGEASHWEREHWSALCLLCFFGTILWPPVRDLDFPPLGLIALGFIATCASALHNATDVHYHNQTAPCVVEEARVGTSGCVASCRPTFLPPGSSLGVLAKSQLRTLTRLRHQCSACTVQLTIKALRKSSQRPHVQACGFHRVAVLTNSLAVSSGVPEQ